ncbi:ATP-binding cassette domain-containing protein [Pseudoclavibacter sp. AY1H1]|uniref:ATP-binding cassette domain-containing protein n=1 Tax=Pseudoclavibacter sp. AY1H1 TaxID=2080584 RepID=UPI000CE79BC7|nr:ATP-binding cassette domain-containing protein [Pseudoclavibacter sp. AY1H1]PPF33379.1 peptide ABC transporter ATP-binding protein [Pseudoclavibacter sp. AY1H1]
MSEELLSVDHLQMRFKNPHNRAQTVHAVDDVSFTVAPGEILGVVGESGSGKSTIGRCILGLEKPSDGSIHFGGRDLTKHSLLRNRRDIAKQLQVVFQDPYSSLNPFRTIGQTLAEPLQAALRLSDKQADARARDMLETVGLPRAAADRFPGQFSGGQRQRIGIARALIMQPQLVVLDEAVSALDLSTQAQILNLLAQLAKERGLAYIFIAHDLDVVRYISHRTLVLYRGRIMEQGPAGDVHSAPLHPYTAALNAAAPVTDPVEQRKRRTARAAAATAATAAAAASATPPSPASPAAPATPATGQLGCPFAARCAFAQEVCRTKRPADTPVGERTVACHMYDATSGHTRLGAGMPAAELIAS